MKTSDGLRKSGDVLRSRGWVQGMWHTGQGPVCMRGATGLAMTGRESGREPDEPIELIRTVIGKRGTVDWNDAPSRTAAEVMQALDAAYVLALQEEGIEPADVL